MQIVFKNFISNTYLKKLEATSPTSSQTTVERKHFQAAQRQTTGKSVFLEENDDAVRELAPHMDVKNNNPGAKHKKAGTELWNSLGVEGRARWQRAAELRAR